MKSPHVNNLNPKSYSENSERQFHTAMKAIQMLDIKGSENILDLGSGDGRVTNVLFKYITTGAIEGWDSSKNMVEFASYHYPHIKFLRREAENLDAQQKYDIITSFSSIHYVSNLNHLFEKIYKALKPGGKTLHLTYLRETPYFNLFFNTLTGKKWSLYPRNYFFDMMLDENGYMDVIHCSKLNPTSVQITDHIIKFRNADHLKREMEIWLPAVIALPEGLMNDFIDEIIEKSSIYQNGERLEIPHKKIVFYLQKMIS